MQSYVNWTGKWCISGQQKIRNMCLYIFFKKQWLSVNFKNFWSTSREKDATSLDAMERHQITFSFLKYKSFNWYIFSTTLFHFPRHFFSFSQIMENLTNFQRFWTRANFPLTLRLKLRKPSNFLGQYSWDLGPGRHEFRLFLVPQQNYSFPPIHFRVHHLFHVPSRLVVEELHLQGHWRSQQVDTKLHDGRGKININNRNKQQKEVSQVNKVIENNKVIEVIGLRFRFVFVSGFKLMYFSQGGTRLLRT